VANTSDLLIRLRADVGQADRALGGVAGQLAKARQHRGFQLGGLGGGLGVTAILGKATQASMQFNDAFADVIAPSTTRTRSAASTTCDATILDLSKNDPDHGDGARADRRQGGQMNVPADQLIDFTRVVAEMGKGTGLSTDQAPKASASWRT
jgi:hypothetical protein